MSNQTHKLQALAFAGMTALLLSAALLPPYAGRITPRGETGGHAAQLRPINAKANLPTCRGTNTAKKSAALGQCALPVASS
jgi:hypothetical protein